MVFAPSPLPLLRHAPRGTFVQPNFYVLVFRSFSFLVNFFFFFFFWYFVLSSGAVCIGRLESVPAAITATVHGKKLCWNAKRLRAFFKRSNIITLTVFSLLLLLIFSLRNEQREALVVVYPRS